MPLDTIGLYNKLEMARERAKNTREAKERLFLEDSLAIAVTRSDVIPSVKAVYTEIGNDLLFTIWSDPLDVELVTEHRPDMGAVLLAAHEDDIESLKKTGTTIESDKMPEARGYPRWRFFISRNGSKEALERSVRELLADAKNNPNI